MSRSVPAKQEEQWQSNVKLAAGMKNGKKLRKLLSSSDQKPSGEALVVAARQDMSGECVQLLIDHGADIHATMDGNTPLHVATYRGNVNGVKALLAAKADPTKLDKQQCDSRFYASQSTANGPAVGGEEEFLEILKLFKKSGVDIHQANFLGGKILPTIVIASEANNENIIEFLIESNADIKARSPISGDTALHYAVKNGNLHVVRKLLELGANTRARCWDKRLDGIPSSTLPIENVVKSRDLRIARAILEYEKQNNISDDDYPVVPEGMVHRSKQNVTAIKQMIAREDASNHSNEAPDTSVSEEGLKIDQDKTIEEHTPKQTRKSCDGCMASGYNLKACSRCKKVYYCCRDCQVFAWTAHHRVYCKKA